MSGYPNNSSGDARPGFRVPPRLVIALLIAGVAAISYFGKFQKNPVTGASQPIPWTVEQEIALGMNSAPRMEAEFGGESSNEKHRQLVEQIGARIVAGLPKEARKPDGSQSYPFQYHVLADPKTVNAFALPGGQIFITEALVSRLETEGQLAGVLGHETGHVLARHSAAQMAKGELMQRLVGAATVAASNLRDGGQMAQAASAMVANMLTLKYSRNDELQADQLGLKFMYLAGYDPRSMINVMEILEQASGGRGSQRPEFSSTHPNPGHRIERIQDELHAMFPNGVPDGLKK
jgi:beta-barrel assembly-enhancing protease